jgi:hypothetical protein
MFRALLAHPQEVLHKRHLVYYVRVVSCLLPGLEFHSNHVAAKWHNTPPEDGKVMLETCRGP